MNDDPVSRRDEPADSGRRYDKAAAEQILRRAADEQARLDVEKDHSYSLEQLQEIATEAGISPEAVRAAALAHDSSAVNAAPGELPAAGDHTGAGWLPASWSPRVRRSVVLGAGVALIGILMAVVGVGPLVIVLALALLVLVLLFGLLGLGPV